MRHPVSRVISLYNYHCDRALDAQHPNHHLNRLAMIRNGKLMSFEQWFETQYSGNHLVRFLYYAMRGESIQYPLVLQSKQLSAAREFLDKCWFVGFTELSRHDIPHVCRSVGVPVPRKQANKSRRHVVRSESQKLAPLIIEKENLDMELFEYAWRLRGLAEPPHDTTDD